jgi:hypothetical protein
MPRYKVDAPGFYDGKFYNPEGKRQFLDVDLPFTDKNPIPSWISKIPEESADVKKKREAYEKSEKAADKAKAKQDKKDIKEASFMGEGEEVSKTIETI